MDPSPLPPPASFLPPTRPEIASLVVPLRQHRRSLTAAHPHRPKSPHIDTFRTPCYHAASSPPPPLSAVPSVTVGTVEPRTVVESVRTLFPWVKFVEAECTGLDPKTKLLKLSNSSQTSSSRVVMDSAKSRPTFALAYDKLVVAVGAENNTFGTPGVEKHAHFLKEISDARRIRSAVTDAFESAANPGQTDEERRRLLNFVVVGGGPTGVEFAAELADLVHEDLKYSFPQLKGMVTIRLVEAMETVLSMFDAKISEYTMEHFKTERIEVLNHTFVKEVKANEVMINKKGTKEIFGIPASVVVWATGIKCRPIINSMKEAIGPLQNNFRGLLTDG